MKRGLWVGVRFGMVVGAVVAMVPLATTAFAWTQPICNPKTGEVLPPSHFKNEQEYNKYIHDHPGSHEMRPGERCQGPAPQPPAPQHPGPQPPAPQPPAPARARVTAGVAPAPAVLAAGVERAAPAPPAPCWATNAAGEIMFTEAGTPIACGSPVAAPLEIAGAELVAPAAGDGTTAD